MAFLKIQYFIFPESKMKVIPLVTPFAVPLTPFTYGSQEAERVPNDKEYTH